MPKSYLTKFDVILIAAYRVRQLNLGAPATIPTSQHKATVVALRELYGQSIDSAILYHDLFSLKQNEALRRKFVSTGQESLKASDRSKILSNNLFNTNIDELFSSLLQDYEAKQKDADDANEVCQITGEFTETVDLDTDLDIEDELDDDEEESSSSSSIKKKHASIAVDFSYEDE